jgi:hypothetical protein
MNNLVIVHDKKIKPLYQKAKENGEVDSCLKRIEDTIPQEDQKLIATMFLEYVTNYNLYIPAARDSLLAAVIFWYQSLSEETTDEMKVKFYDRYLNTMNKLGVLDFKKLVIEMSRQLKKASNQAKQVEVEIEN